MSIRSSRTVLPAQRGSAPANRLETRSRCTQLPPPKDVSSDFSKCFPCFKLRELGESPSRNECGIGDWIRFLAEALGFFAQIRLCFLRRHSIVIVTSQTKLFSVCSAHSVFKSIPKITKSNLSRFEYATLVLTCGLEFSGSILRLKLFVIFSLSQVNGMLTFVTISHLMSCQITPAGESASLYSPINHEVHTLRSLLRSLNVAAFLRSTVTVFFLHALHAHSRQRRGPWWARVPGWSPSG